MFANFNATATSLTERPSESICIASHIRNSLTHSCGGRRNTFPKYRRSWLPEIPHIFATSAASYPDLRARSGQCSINSRRLTSTPISANHILFHLLFSDAGNLNPQTTSIQLQTCVLIFWQNFSPATTLVLFIDKEPGSPRSKILPSPAGNLVQIEDGRAAVRISISRAISFGMRVPSQNTAR